MGFYTLSIKSLKLNIDISKNIRKRISGGYPNLDNAVVYLIGQLAKNDTYASEITGKELVERAIVSINRCHNIVGGRIILVERNDLDKLAEFYKKCGFEDLQKDDDGLVQMISYI